jgi:CheY-like chemotaxis protein
MLTVLVVDDDHLVASGTTDMLHDLGHVAFEVNSGADALRTLGHRKVDIVLADQSMPGMTGTQLAKKFRDRWPDLPILLASGHAEIPERTALNLPRLTKPYRMHWPPSPQVTTSRSSNWPPSCGSGTVPAVPRMVSPQRRANSLALRSGTA